MDPLHPSGWKTDQKQLANWSDSDTDTYTCNNDTDVSSDEVSSFNSLSSDGEEEEDDAITLAVGYHKLLQSKKVYKVILEEEELIS
jgi:hypothetical protein